MTLFSNMRELYKGCSLYRKVIAHTEKLQNRIHLWFECNSWLNNQTAKVIYKPLSTHISYHERDTGTTRSDSLTIIIELFVLMLTVQLATILNKESLDFVTCCKYRIQFISIIYVTILKYSYCGYAVYCMLVVLHRLRSVSTLFHLNQLVR